MVGSHVEDASINSRTVLDAQRVRPIDYRSVYDLYVLCTRFLCFLPVLSRRILR